MVRHFRSIRRNNAKHLTRRMRGGMFSGFNLSKAAGLAGDLVNSALESPEVKQFKEDLKEQAKQKAQEGFTKAKQFKEDLKEQAAAVIKEKFNDALSNQKVQEGLAQALQLKQELTATAENAILEALSILNRKYPVLYNGVAQFNAIDKDGNGSISYNEFIAAFPGQPDQPDQPNQFAKCDTSGDGSLNLVEFITCMKPKQGGRSSSRKYKYTNKLRNSRRSRSY